MAWIIALITMVVFLYVPHHHHEESICIGNYDCKSSKHHSHHDECGGKESKDFCCAGGAYVVSRYFENDRSDWQIKDYKHFIDIVDVLIHYSSDYKEVQDIAFLPERVVVPALGFEALRSPPCVNL